MNPLRRPIDWSLISEGVKFYTDRGYEYIEVPWLVPREITRMTAPLPIIPLATQDGDPVGSAEQSFLAMYTRGQLMRRPYCAVSPCFRDDEEDELHGRHFIKLELFSPDPDDDTRMLLDAADFFDRYVGVRRKVIDTHQQDLVCMGIELGSYGRRKVHGIEWSYGTGVAEPRLSTVISRWGSVRTSGA